MEPQPQNFEAQPQNLEAQPQNIETQQGTSKLSLRIHLLPFPAEERGAPKAPQGSAKRCPTPKAARSAAPSDRPKIAERRRRDRRAGSTSDELQNLETQTNRNTNAILHG